MSLSVSSLDVFDTIDMQEYCSINEIFLGNLFVKTHSNSILQQGGNDNLPFIERTLLKNDAYALIYKEELRRLLSIHCDNINTTVFNVSDVTISLHAFGGLRTRQWTTDSVIDSFSSLLQQKLNLSASSQKSNQAFIFNTFLYVSLMSNNNRSCFDYSRVMRYNKDVDLTKNELLLFPIHMGEQLQHWTLVAVYLQKKELYYIDSLDLHSYGKNVSVNILKFLYGWYQQHKTVKEFDLASWKMFDRAIISPKQFNTDDCGIYVMMYMDCLCNGVSIGWIDHENLLNNYRNYIACCLLSEEIID